MRPTLGKIVSYNGQPAMIVKMTVVRGKAADHDEESYLMNLAVFTDEGTTKPVHDVPFARYCRCGDANAKDKWVWLEEI